MSRSKSIIIATLGLVFFTSAMLTAVNADTVNFSSLVRPDPEFLLPSPSHTYQHDLINVGFNPDTDTLSAAEFQIFFTEEDPFGGSDDSVTIFFDTTFQGVSQEPDDPFSDSWNDVFTVNVDFLQSDGILSVELQSDGNTIFNMSELTAEATRVLPPTDTDLDGVSDLLDNCLFISNQDQLDNDGDGIGNICDGDFDGNCIVNFIDLGDMKAAFFQIGNFPEDMDGNGHINFLDLGLFKGEIFKDYSATNPSGISNICDGG